MTKTQKGLAKHPVTELSEDKDGPRPMRRCITFLGITQLAKLDREVLRRKAAGEDKNEEGVRINVNRSLVLRDLVDEKWPG